MQIRSNTKLYLRVLFYLSLILIPMTFVNDYFLTINNKMENAVDFSINPPIDKSSFLKPNFTRLNEMANFYDYRFEKYHIPLNMSTDTIFTNESCTDVARYTFSDNTGQWTGLAITGWAFKYKTAIIENNQTLRDESLRVIRKLLSGMEMQLAVPNGGLGPEFGGVLARGWAGPQHRNIPGVEWYFGDGNGRHHNGTGIYSQYRWRGYTSNDEYSGYYAGLAITYKFVEIPEIRDRISILVDQIASYMIKNNFLGMDWSGAPTGVRQRPLFMQGGVWAALLLKLAAITNSSKFGGLYHHYIAEELYAWWTKESGIQETVSNYYAYAFGYHIVLAYLLLEDNPDLHQLALKNYFNSLRKYTATHRNPFFNICHLILTAKPGEFPDLEADVLDQLTRYDSPYHFPDRALGHANISEDKSYYFIENIEELQDFLKNDSYGGYYAPIFLEFEPNNLYTNKPMTVEYLQGDIFIWEKNPWQYKETQYINPNFEYASFSFSLVYWMGRAYGFIKKS